MGGHTEWFLRELRKRDAIVIVELAPFLDRIAARRTPNPKLRMRDERRWTTALAEHETVVRGFLSACEAVGPNDWQCAPAPAKWSPAAVVLHVCRAYELGRDAIAGGPSMRLLVAPPAAWFARTIVLPVLLATKRFPRGASSPREVVPDASEARQLSPAAARARLQSAADVAAKALRRAAGDRTAIRVTHAYFGALTPYYTLRLLSAHTRHHARELTRAVAIMRAG